MRSNSASYTMDYETKEIIVTIYTNDAQVQTRFSEKDIKAMKNWFELAKHMNRFKLGRKEDCKLL